MAESDRSVQLAGSETELFIRTLFRILLGGLILKISKHLVLYQIKIEKVEKFKCQYEFDFCFGLTQQLLLYLARFGSDTNR